MNLLLKPAAVFFSAYAMLSLPAIKDESLSRTVAVHVNNNPKIQAAILLDVSNSMDGLI